MFNLNKCYLVTVADWPTGIPESSRWVGNRIITLGRWTWIKNFIKIIYLSILYFIVRL
jgi:hypothetical protein